MATPSLDRLFGSGILAQPSTITNPLQNPMDPQSAAALEAANAQERMKRVALQQTLLRAQALKEQPVVRQGQGPMGYMTSIGDAIAGVINKQRQKKATEDVTGGLGDVGGAENATFEALNALRRRENSPSFVAQGSPLGGMAPPLSY